MGYIQPTDEIKEHCFLWYWTTLCQQIINDLFIQFSLF